MALSLIGTYTASNLGANAVATGISWQTGDVITVASSGTDAGIVPTNANLTFTERVTQADSLEHRASVFTAVAASTQSGQSVSLAFGVASNTAEFCLQVWRGADTTAFSNVASVNDTVYTYPEVITVPSCAVGSYVIGSNIIAGSTATFTANAGTTITFQQSTGLNNTVFCTYQSTSAVAVAGNVTLSINDSDGGSKHVMAAMEIKAAPLASSIRFGGWRFN